MHAPTTYVLAKLSHGIDMMVYPLNFGYRFHTQVSYRITLHMMFGSTTKIEFLARLERRRRSSAVYMPAIHNERWKIDATDNLVAHRNRIAPNQSFKWANLLHRLHWSQRQRYRRLSLPRIAGVAGLS
jgi:hypothetical protein